MFRHKETEKLFDLFSLNDNYKYETYIANGVDTGFYYLEFEKESLSYYEMKLALLRDKSIFYEARIHQAICYFHNICGYNDGNRATSDDIFTMKNMMNDVFRHMDLYKGKGSWCSKEESEEDDPNNTIVGYYLNHKWQSDTFPDSLIDKIHSADKYVTLINEGSEVMIVMEHNKKKSLFYSLNDQ